MSHIFKLNYLFICLFFYSKTTFSSNLNPEKHTQQKENISHITDTINLKKKYELLENLFIEKKHIEALNGAFELLSNSNIKKNRDIEFLTNFLIADIFAKIGNYKKSFLFHKKSLELINFHKKESLEKSTNSILFNKYYPRILLGLGSEFLALEKLDSAKLYFDKIITQINPINENTKNILAKTSSNLSGIYLRQGDFKSAKQYALKAISIYENNRNENNKTFEASALNNLANIYLLEENYPKAKEVYFRGVKLIEKNHSSSAIKFKEDLYFNLAWVLYKMKDYKAYDFQEKSYLIKDSLRDKEIRQMIEQVYAQQKVDLEKEKTALVEEQRKLVEAQQEKTSLLFGALSLLVVIISGVVIYNYKLRQKNLKLKLSENNLLQQQDLQKLRSEAHTKILNAALDGKETERKQIAETLHDNVSALLSSANMHLSATKKQLEGNSSQDIEKTQAIILEASQKVRDLSHNLISSILLKFGLEYALKDVVKKYSNRELKFTVTAKNINRYNQEFEIRVYNVIQELINNIIKHSKAKNAQISIIQEKNQLTVLVKDDGVGFSTSSSSISDGIGLNQIEARVKMLNGKLVINSEISNGTSVYISLPIQDQKKVNLSSVS